MHSKKIRVRASLLGLSTLLLSVAPIIALNCCGKSTSDATDTGEQIVAETTTAITTTIATTEPRFAAAIAASQPACPPPTTMTS